MFCSWILNDGGWLVGDAVTGETLGGAVTGATVGIAVDTVGLCVDEVGDAVFEDSVGDAVFEDSVGDTVFGYSVGDEVTGEVVGLDVDPVVGLIGVEVGAAVDTGVWVGELVTGARLGRFERVGTGLTVGDDGGNVMRVDGATVVTPFPFPPFPLLFGKKFRNGSRLSSWLPS